MEILKTINPEKVDKKNIPDWKYRKAARAVVFDDKNRIGLLHVSSKNYYKLPGGGIVAKTKPDYTGQWIL